VQRLKPLPVHAEGSPLVHNISVRSLNYKKKTQAIFLTVNEMIAYERISGFLSAGHFTG
jgi:hypothetical protein